MGGRAVHLDPSRPLRRLPPRRSRRPVLALRGRDGADDLRPPDARARAGSSSSGSTTTSPSSARPSSSPTTGSGAGSSPRRRRRSPPRSRAPPVERRGAPRHPRAPRRVAGTDPRLVRRRRTSSSPRRSSSRRCASTRRSSRPATGQGLSPPYFLAVADHTGDPKGHIVRGNEWVLNARFADARFFWDDDGKVPLEERVPRLARLSFQEKLGDTLRKTERVEALSERLAVEPRVRRLRPGGDPRGAARPGRPRHRHGPRVPRPAGRRRRPLRPAGRRGRGGLAGGLRPLPPRGRRRRAAPRRGGAHRRARRPARHARGLLRARPRPDRLARPVRPPARGARSRPDPPRGEAPPRPPRGDRGGPQAPRRPGRDGRGGRGVAPPVPPRPAPLPPRAARFPARRDRVGPHDRLPRRHRRRRPGRGGRRGEEAGRLRPARRSRSRGSRTSSPRRARRPARELDPALMSDDSERQLAGDFYQAKGILDELVAGAPLRGGALRHGVPRAEPRPLLHGRHGPRRRRGRPREPALPPRARCATSSTGSRGSARSRSRPPRTSRRPPASGAAGGARPGPRDVGRPSPGRANAVSFASEEDNP